MLSVVVPTCNERENIATLIGHVEEVLSGHAREFELIVVDDGSPDGTSDVVRELMAARPWVQLVERREARDLGGVGKKPF